MYIPNCAWRKSELTQSQGLLFQHFVLCSPDAYSIHETLWNESFKNSFSILLILLYYVYIIILYITDIQLNAFKLTISVWSAQIQIRYYGIDVSIAHDVHRHNTPCHRTHHPYTKVSVHWQRWPGQPTGGGLVRICRCVRTTGGGQTRVCWCVRATGGGQVRICRCVWATGGGHVRIYWSVGATGGGQVRIFRCVGATGGGQVHICRCVRATGWGWVHICRCVMASGKMLFV